MVDNQYPILYPDYVNPDGSQPREHSVPCQRCGYDPRIGKIRTMTMNISALCDTCEEKKVN